MASEADDLEQFLAGRGPVAMVSVASTRGSAPREAGTFMLVARDAIFGTIGGGQLEYIAIDEARRGLGRHNVRGINDEHFPRRLDVPLGPEIGQCCGGRVELAVCTVDADLAARLVAAARAEALRRPNLYIFGGGHVGAALARAVAPLPIRTAVVETRQDALENLPGGVEAKLTPVPESLVRKAPAGSAFVVLTHDHALDFLIVAEALRRADAAYVGMIGSKSKRAVFRNWFLGPAGGEAAAFARLVSPIGGRAVRDKRPPVIAALVAAEIVTALARTPAVVP